MMVRFGSFNETRRRRSKRAHAQISRKKKQCQPSLPSLANPNPLCLRRLPLSSRRRRGPGGQFFPRLGVDIGAVIGRCSSHLFCCERTLLHDLQRMASAGGRRREGREGRSDAVRWPDRGRGANASGLIQPSIQEVRIRTSRLHKKSRSHEEMGGRTSSYSAMSSALSSTRVGGLLRAMLLRIRYEYALEIEPRESSRVWRCVSMDGRTSGCC